jgi:hypothetical protein
VEHFSLYFLAYWSVTFATQMLKNSVFWDVTPCGSLMKQALIPPKLRFLQEPHSVTSQKTPFFIVTAVKTSNVTQMLFHSVLRTDDPLLIVVIGLQATFVTSHKQWSSLFRMLKNVDI